MFPVEGRLDAVVEILALSAGEVAHLAEKPKRQSCLEMQSVEAGHVGVKGCRTAEALHLLGAKDTEFVCADGLEPLGKNGDARDSLGLMAVFPPHAAVLHVTTAVRMARSGLDRTR